MHILRSINYQTRDPVIVIGCQMPIHRVSWVSRRVEWERGVQLSININFSETARKHTGLRSPVVHPPPSSLKSSSIVFCDFRNHSPSRRRCVSIWQKAFYRRQITLCPRHVNFWKPRSLMLMLWEWGSKWVSKWVSECECEWVSE